MLNKIKGGFFGLAIGDALGAPSEFLNKRTIQQLYYNGLTEMVGGGLFNWKPGETTDDTAMTLCVAKGFLTNPVDPIPSIGEEFLSWFHSNPKDIGNGCRLAIEYFEMSSNWSEAALDAHYGLGGKSAGNGALMRALPIPLLVSNYKRQQELAEKQSNMTHYDSLSARCCQIYSEAVSDILSGKDFKETIKNAFSLLLLPESELLSPTCDSDGYVLNTLCWVLHLCYTSDSFEQVVVRAANLGGDTDTIGAIAGGLYGVYCGFDNLPIRYVSALLNKQELESIALDTYNYRFKN